MPSPEALTAITIAFYFFATAAGMMGMIWRKALLRRLGSWLAIASFLCQTLILIFGFHKLLPEGLSFGAYLQLLAWFFLLSGIGAWQYLRQDAILLFAAPLGLILFLMSAPWLELTIHLPESLSTPFYALHIGSLFLSLGLLALASVAAFLFLFLERRIKSKKTMKGLWQDMPALSMLDRINCFCCVSAFPLYTTGIIAGLIWSRPVFGAAFSGDPKEIMSIMVWGLLGLLFYNRVIGGWRGRKPAILALVIFVLSLFSIICINLFLSDHHGYIRG